MTYMAIIIVIDDQDDVRKIVRCQLASAGYDVLEAANGCEGLALCRKHKPALVVSDIFMPVKDGIETIRELRREQPAVKIIAMSGCDPFRRAHYLDAAKKLGADAALGKPWRAAELLATVALLLAS